MGACYGVGVRGSLPHDAFPTQADELAFMMEFAGLGLSHRFRDVIGDRVIEFSFSKKEVTTRELEASEAAPILETHKRLGGSAPYSLLEAFWSDDMLFIPGFRGRRGFTLDQIDPEHLLHGFSVAPLRNALAIAKECIEHYEGEEGDQSSELMLLRGLLKDFEFCAEHKLIYCFGY